MLGVNSKSTPAGANGWPHTPEAGRSSMVPSKALPVCEGLS